MRLALTALFVVACGGAARPLAIERAPSRLELARLDIRYWAAMTDESGDDRRPMSADFHAGATVVQAEVDCDVDALANETPKVSCVAGTPSAAPTDDEKWFSARFAECFQVRRVAPDAATLRQIERTLSPDKWWPTAPPSAAATEFVIIHVTKRSSLRIDPQAGGNGCEGVHHPCDPGPSVQARPGGWLTNAQRTFVAYGPRAYAFRSGSRKNLFPETGTQAIYAIPDDDPSFHVNEIDLRPTYDALARRSGGDETTRFALALDRAVLASRLGDLAVIRERTRELDDFLAAHPPQLDADASARLAFTRAALHAIVRGDYALSDPCKSTALLAK